MSKRGERIKTNNKIFQEKGIYSIFPKKAKRRNREDHQDFHQKNLQL